MKHVLLLIFIIVVNLNAKDIYIDNIIFEKVKKLVKQEEQIALAYKTFIKKEAYAPSIDNLINKNYLPKGFSKINIFKKEIKILANTNQIEDAFPSSVKLKTNVYDYYYSSKNRKYTKAPFSRKNNNINIILNTKEKYILKYKDEITTILTDAKDKYYLDAKGILHWYNSSGEYKYSVAKDLIVDKSIGEPGTNGFTSYFSNLNKEVLYSGQTIFYMDEDAEEYLNLGEKGGFIRIGEDESDIGKTILQFTRRAGGIIINGDIYTWGNNNNKVVAIGNNSYTNIDGDTGTGKPIINVLVKAKALTYNSKIDDRNYFSSPLRPKFNDFTSDVWHSTCGVSTKGELYCGGANALNGNWTYFDDYNRSSKINQEYLYRNEFFDGTKNKAIRLFGLIATWVVLGSPEEEYSSEKKEGYIYYWGKNNNAYAPTGSKSSTAVYEPTKASNIKFKDLTYTLSVGYRRVAALTPSGDIYTWGLDSRITKDSCIHTIENKSVNLCEPVKVESDIVFTSILGGQQTFLAKDEAEKFYRISQAKINDNASLAKVDKINDLIKDYDEFDATNDADIISVDISSKINGSSLDLGQGIVWVNSKNELKGDYFTPENKNDDFFKASIQQIKWKKIRVVEDKNGMCGIDIYNQMYCWGAMSFYTGGNNSGNTYMLPMFMANLHDLDKDFMFSAGGNADGKTKNVTNMTSGEWTRSISGKSGEYFIKYPTYFGGFNYEFTFK